jgi:catecholate siderophore receptor
MRSVVRFGRTVRDSLITAPRFDNNTSTAIRRTDWKSRDQSDAVVASQTDVTSRFRTGAVGHALVTGLELSRETSENWNRIEEGGAQPTTDLFNPDFNARYESHLVRNGAVNDATARSAAVFAFDTVQLGSRFEVTGGLRWDRFALDYRTVDAVATESTVERTDDMVSWRGGAVFKPRANGSVYGGVGTSLNPSTEGLTQHQHGPARAGTGAQCRGRHQMGSVRRASGRQRSGVQHDEDQCPDPRRQPGRSANRSPGKAHG